MNDVKLLRHLSLTPDSTPAAVKPFRPLTDGQERVIRLLAKGYNTRSIARRLQISRRTVQAHICRVSDLLPDDGLEPVERVRIWSILRCA